MLSLKVTTIDASAGLILPKEVLARFKVKEGDTIFLTQAPDGGYRLTPSNVVFERQMSLAETVMRDDSDLLRGLAK